MISKHVNKTVIILTFLLTSPQAFSSNSSKTNACSFSRICKLVFPIVAIANAESTTTQISCEKRETQKCTSNLDDLFEKTVEISCKGKRDSKCIREVSLECSEKLASICTNKAYEICGKDVGKQDSRCHRNFKMLKKVVVWVPTGVASYQVYNDNSKNILSFLNVIFPPIVFLGSSFAAEILSLPEHLICNN